MSKHYVIKNQDRHYLSKNAEYWLDGSEPHYVFKTKHHDVALNTMIEFNSQHIDMRCEIAEINVDEKMRPELEISPTTAKMPTKRQGQELAEPSNN